MVIEEDKISLRRAILADVDRITALTDAAYSSYIPLIGRKPQPMTVDYSRMVTENTIWLLSVQDELAGLLVLVYEPQDLLIYSIAIHPAYQKNGLGRRLMAQAEKLARDAGYESIRLYTNERFSYNIALYQWLGYQETGREPLLGSNIVHMRKVLRD